MPSSYQDARKDYESSFYKIDPRVANRNTHTRFIMTISRVYLNNKRISTGRWLKDNKFLQVYPELKYFSSEVEWRTEWTKKINDGISFRIELDTPPLQCREGTNWICSYCKKGPGNDHRMCICRAFNYNAQAWEAARMWQDTPSSQPTQPTSTASTPKETKVILGQSVKGKVALKAKKNNKAIDWTFYPKMFEATASPGKYYIGDLCYALHESTYDEVFGGSGYESGLYECTDGFFMVDGTAYGDGAYKGTDRKEYLVDAGIIGIASWKVVDEENPSLSGGQIHTFKDPVKIRFRGGVFEFTSPNYHLKIDTQGEDDEDDY